jgi:hypothetical protein
MKIMAIENRFATEAYVNNAIDSVENNSSI